MVISITTLGFKSTVSAQESTNKNPVTDLIEPEPVIKETLPKKETKKPKKLKVIKYTVKSGDTLIKIAKKRHTTWRRLFDKNRVIKHPDLLSVNQTLIIPVDREKLKHRKLPEGYGVTLSSNLHIPLSSPRSTPGSTLNLYEPGQCTWHVKNLAPWVPNSWGNATDWLFNAQAQGYKTSSTPKPGTVGWVYGHVVFVKAVKGNQVLISEMNYDWVPYHQREIWMPVSHYTYIYQ